MGSASSMLTQYDIEEVQEHCNDLLNKKLYPYIKDCQLDRNAKGLISADEFLSIPEFAMNPLSQRLLKMVDGLNFKDFVAFLPAFSARASMQQKSEHKFFGHTKFDVSCYSNGYLNTARAFVYALICNCVTVIFRVYDSDCNGKVSFNDVLEVLRDLSGSFLSDEQREEQIINFPCVLCSLRSFKCRMCWPKSCKKQVKQRNLL